jgi:hypothetical protein
LAGEIVLVPLANPIGVAQRVLGQTLGRFSLAEGDNFNRHYADLSTAVFDRLRPAIDAGAAPGVAEVRAELRRACAELSAASEIDSLRRCLLGLAIDADIVLDLHCDSEAVLHLYAATPQWPQVEPLARATRAEVCLLATDSGDDPFDESCSMLWSRLNAHWREHTGKRDAWPLACVAVTLELRGEADVRHDLAQADASAIIAALHHAGFLHGAAPELPALRHPATPLAGSMPVRTPAGGVLVHLAPLGAHVVRGERIAEVIDVISGCVHPLDSPCDGVLYARVSGRTVQAGLSVAKVAGATAVRSGKLLSA